MLYRPGVGLTKSFKADSVTFIFESISIKVSIEMPESRVVYSAPGHSIYNRHLEIVKVPSV